MRDRNLAEYRSIESMDISLVPDEDQRKFLRTLADTGSVRRSVDAAGVTMNDYRRWRRESPLFASAMKLLPEIRRELLEESLWDHAINGHETPVFDNKGRHSGDKVTYNDTTRLRLIEKVDPSYAQSKGAVINASGQVQIVLPDNGRDPPPTIGKAEQ